MNVNLSTNRKFKRILANILSIFAILAIAIPVTSVAYAVSSSPFVGHWQATDSDGSDIRLTIGGPPSGPFQITWTESYVSFCNREAGIVRGTGQLNESNPYLLEADLHLECFTTGASTDFHLSWGYHPVTNTLSSRYDNGVVIIWHQPGRPLPPPPMLGLRVNYGHDWVESFYEGGHMAWITVTESDGVTVKAFAELVTEPKDFWGGETGFQTRPEDWIPAPPDIQPNDWVFGWVDNGASAQVQIGDISGMINLAGDSIEGTIMAPWITDPVQVECLDWGSGDEPFANKDGGFVLTTGDDPYSCSWAGEWDIQPGQNVGVGYFGPEGHWVANAFFASNPNLYALADENKIFAQEWIAGFPLELKIYDVLGTESYSNSQLVAPPSEVPWTLVVFDLEAAGFDLLPGQRIVLNQRGYVRELVVSSLAITGFDLANQQVMGTGDAGAQIFIRINGEDVWGEVGGDGNWVISHPQLAARVWGEAIQPDGIDGDETRDGFQAPNPNLYALADEDKIFAQEWIAGRTLDLKIHDSMGAEVYSSSQVVEPPSVVPWTLVVFDLEAAGFDLASGQRVVLNQGGYQRELIVSSLRITGFDYDTQQVIGTGDAGAQIFIRINGEDIWGEIGGDGNWVISHPQLAPGVWGEAIQPDGIDGDETRDGFQAPFE